MRLFWKRPDLERELRAARPRPPAELESRLEAQIADDRTRDRHRAPRARLGFAAATTVALLVAFAAAGGMAAASSSVRSAFTDMARVVHIAAPQRQAAPDSAATPAVDQYGRKKSCVKAAVARRNAAIRRADAKLKRDLALATKIYKKRVGMARKLTSTAKRDAALKAAYAKYVKARRAAYRRHTAAVKRALARYRADIKKCPIV
jgi:hypothetical protein